MRDEDFAQAVRRAAGVAEFRGGGWGVVTHEDPFGNRSIEVNFIGAVWEKHGVDANGQCRTCAERAVLRVSALSEGQDADVLVRPLSEAKEYGNA